MIERLAPWFLAVLLSISGLTGCSRCSSTPMATLTEKAGAIDRDFQASIEQWRSAELGADFELGDGVKTREAATGTITFDDGALLRLEPETTVRFLATEPKSGEKSIDIQTGAATLEAGDSAIRVRTQLGVAVLDRGSVARLSRSDRGLRILVSVGMATLETKDGPQDLRPGQGVEVGIGMAILERFDESPPVEAELAPTAPVVDEPVPKAVTVDLTGRGASVKRAEGGSFTPLAEGEHTLQPGAQLKLSRGDAASVRRGKASAELSGPGTFVVVEDPKHLVEPVLGTVTLRAENKDVSMEIPGGTLTALGSRELSIAEVQVEQGRVRLWVRAGKLRVELKDGSSTLDAGESGDIQRGKLTIGGRGLNYFDLSVTAGGSLLVHDPAPPTAIAIEFGDHCPGAGIVERRGDRGAASASGQGQASLAFERGRHTYQLFCISPDGKRGAPKAKGSITILADAGTMALPTKAPSTTVNTDGRDYTVLYQNLLPQVTVRWPNAPEASSYALVVTSSGKTQRVSAGSASHSFSPGQLGEGAHSFQWMTSSGRKSRPSRATIRFDNAAPKASIVSPVNGSFQPGASVAVSGIALPGWQVRARGEALHMDGQQRFSGMVQSGPRGLVLTFTHPERGVHYYVRRASGISR
jgi:hypothetical protein